MRLDLLLVKYEMVRSRSHAEELIKRGDVQVYDLQRKTWTAITKPSFKVDENLEIQYLKIESVLSDIVARSGYKLKKAIEHLNIKLEGLKCLDVGQSTGGFSQVLLESKAGLVVGLDVGKNQLNSELLKYSNLKSFESLDIRHASQNIEFCNYIPFDLVVVDVSFISLTQILDVLKALMTEQGQVLALVKPQFELSKADLDKKGRVKDEKKYLEVETKIKDYIQQKLDLAVLDYFKSDLEGKDGNKEYFVYFKFTN